jgi:hypothetical protein
MRTLNTDQPPPGGLRIVGDRDPHGSMTGMNQPPPPRRRRLPIVLIAAVAVIAAVIAVVITVTGRHTTSPAAHAPAGPPAAVTPATSTPAASAASAAVSTPTPLVTTIPTSPPAGVTWQLFQGVAVPTSATDGPTRITGTVYAGYSHTPTGALIAAVQISSRQLITPNGGWRPVVQQQVLPSADRDTFVTARGAVSDEPPAGGFAQIAGFRFVTYDPSIAVISLANKSPTGALGGGDYTLRWVDNDWRLQASSPTTQIEPLANLANYIPWQGVS